MKKVLFGVAIVGALLGAAACDWPGDSMTIITGNDNQNENPLPPGTKPGGVGDPCNTDDDCLSKDCNDEARVCR